MPMASRFDIKRAVRGAAIQTGHQANPRIQKWLCNRAQAVRRRGDVAVAHDQQFVARFAREPAQLVDLAVRPNVRPTHDEPYGAVGKLLDQPIDDRNCGIVGVGNCEEDLELRIALTAKAREMIVRVVVETPDWLEDADRERLTPGIVRTASRKESPRRIERKQIVEKRQDASAKTRQRDQVVRHGDRSPQQHEQYA